MTLAARLAGLSQDERSAVLGSMPEASLKRLPYLWELWARPDQMPPPRNRDGYPDWRTWLLLAGRGAGKTRTASEWVRSEIEAGRRVQIGVVGPTADAVRRVQVEGPSGLLSVSPDWDRPTYEPSTRRVLYPNGAVVHLFSAEEPDRLRGPNLDGFWGDEITSWNNAPAVWDMLQMCVRIPGPKGDSPCGIISTTPKQQPLLRAIMASPSTVITRAKTSDNAANLDTSTLTYLNDKYGNTRLGRQELDAELLEDAEGALWTRQQIEDCRTYRLPAMKRVVIGIDPAGSSNRDSDETGIIGCGVGHDARGYVLADASGKYTPDGWARAAIGLYRSLKADRIVVEKNYGGDMVLATLRAVDPSVPVKMVTATRGKAVRAEPCSALYEQNRVSHVGAFPKLEDQMATWSPNEPGSSPDRVDALVWALTELMVQPQPAPAQFFYFNLLGR